MLTQLKPIAFGLKPDRITKHGEQGIMIFEIDMEQIDKSTIKKVGLEIIIVGKLNPRLSIFGIPSIYKADDI